MMRRTTAIGASLALVGAMLIGSTSAIAADRDAKPEVISEEPSTITLETSKGTTFEVVDRSTTQRGSSSTPSLEGTGDLRALEGGDLNVELPDEVAEAFSSSPLAQIPVGEPAPTPEPGPGQIAPFTVIGADTRYQVPNVTTSPHIQTPFIYYSRGGQDYICTGWLIGVYSIATAGHCLYQDGEYSSNIQVYFGMNGFSAVAACTVDHTAVPSGWTASYAHTHDWGIVQLNCNAGAVFGAYGYRVPTTGSGQSGTNVTGYPGDKYTATGGYTMWQDTGTVTWIDTNKIWYQMDTAGGQSGGPVWRLESGTSCGNCAIGIHAYGIGVDPGIYAGHNSATRITTAVASALNVYRAGWVIST